MIIIPLTFVLTLAGAVGFLVTNGVRASSRSASKLEAYYIADAGAQLGNAKCRVEGLDMEATEFTASLNGETANVVVEDVSTNFYKVTSTATVNGEDTTVQIYVKIDTEITKLAAQSGFEVTFGDDVNINGDLWIDLDSNAFISGEDYDANGNKLADQSNAVPALGVHSTYADTDFNLKTKANSYIIGQPTNTSNTLSDQQSALVGLHSAASSGADVYVTGETKLTDDDIGNFGTSADPVVAFVSLGENETFTLGSNFVGYGLLVVDIGKNSNMEMLSNTKWHGMIILRPNGDPSTENVPLMWLDSDAVVIGSVQMFIDIDGTVANGHQQIKLDGNSKILYSSSMIDAALYEDENTSVEQVTDIWAFRVE